MIIEKSEEMENLSDSLSEALEDAFKYEDVTGIWIQKYNDDGCDLWYASCFNSREGKNLLTPLEIEGIKSIYSKISEKDNFKELLEEMIHSLEAILYTRWKDKDTIDIETTIYTDYYDMYGLNQRDFF